MSRVYLFSNKVDRPVYRARRLVALREAREISRHVDHVVEVEMIDLQVMPKLDLVEACLNGNNWGNGSSRVAVFRRGKTIKNWGDEDVARPE